MAANWRQGTVSELQAAGILLVEDGNHGESRPRHEEFTNIGVAFIRAADIDSGTVLFGAASKINETARRRITKGIGAPGDVLLTHKGTVGKVALVRDDAPSYVCSPQTTLWRTRNLEVLDRRYLYAFLRSPAFHAQLASRSGETDMAPYVSLTAQRTLVVDLPPIEHQRAVGSILGALDDKIELNRRTNETLEAMARALFKSWFVDFDPVRAKAAGKQPSGMDAATAALFPSEIVDLEMGEIPKGWSHRPLSEWASTLSGGTPSKDKPAYWGGTIPWISPKAMMSLHADASDEMVTEHALGNGTRLAPLGSCLVMVRGMGLHEEVRVSQARRDVAFNQDVKALVPRGIQPSLLLFAMLNGQEDLLLRVESSGHGTGRLPSDILLSHPITMPPIEAQAGLGAHFDAINSRIDSARKETKTLAAARDTLLPRLLSGELRIPDAERIVGATT